MMIVMNHRNTEVNLAFISFVVEAELELSKELNNSSLMATISYFVTKH